MQFTLFTSNSSGNLTNTLYPNQVVVKDEASLVQSTAFDHVTAEYQNHHRSNANFLWADCIPMDCDNDHSDDEKEWVTPLEVAFTFPDVAFAVVYSRNHNKVKGNKSARPRFHIYFPINKMDDSSSYTQLKNKVAEQFPYFDNNALDSARLLFGTSNPQVEFYDGNQTVDGFIGADDFALWDEEQTQIPEGGRNNTMSNIAGKLIKRYGNTDEAHQLFLKESLKCNPPLEDFELKKIWQSAVSFGRKVQKQEGYIEPEKYNLGLELVPADFTDVGQAKVLVENYQDKMRYSPSTKFIVFNGSFWEESELKAQLVAQELSERQLEEADSQIEKIMQEMVKNGAMEILATVGAKKAISVFNKVQELSFKQYEAAMEYKKYALKRRDSRNITTALKEVSPMIEITPQELDVDEFLLNKPKDTIQLKTGKVQDHQATDFITKQTEVALGNKGAAIWQEALNTIFCGDKELIDYVQQIVGLSAIGKVYVEALIIAFGDGRNGKSTFWNVISRVMGSYAGTMSADILTVGCRRNVKPELAEAMGKRLLIAAELEEGMRLNTSNVKQLCSTDSITAEKKFKSPFDYIPSHTLVLYTNHLPKVGAIDQGTWRRLIVIPFLAKIEGNSEIKNYADYLFENAGESILTWIVDGAKKVIHADYKIPLPQKVQDAIGTYKENNDWFGSFLSECCELDAAEEVKSGELYAEYRAFCMRTGDYTRSTTDFYSAIESEGFKKNKTKKGSFVKGLRLKSDFED